LVVVQFAQPEVEASVAGVEGVDFADFVNVREFNHALVNQIQHTELEAFSGVGVGVVD
jgi:hypothetical protein